MKKRIVILCGTALVATVAVIVYFVLPPDDFGAFLVQAVRMHGGRLEPGVTLPKVPARWTFKSSEHGFDAWVRGASFDTIEAFVQQAFGAPEPIVQSTADGRPRRIWHGAEIGVTIQCVDRSDCVQVTCAGERKGWSR